MGCASTSAMMLTYFCTNQLTYLQMHHGRARKKMVLGAKTRRFKTFPASAKLKQRPIDR